MWHFGDCYDSRARFGNEELDKIKRYQTCDQGYQSKLLWLYYNVETISEHLEQLWNRFKNPDI